ncbi:MAG: head GIN domain-containing protein [Bacteroidales bacterium]|jgi:hypothetical protein|nr:head GIN domain-containing protein [Bacteroidales bacterium]
MKHLFTALTVLLVAVTSCIPLFNCIQGNGRLGTETRRPATFTSIANATAVDVIFSESDTFGILLTAEENLLPYIITEVSGNTLEIRNKQSYGCIRFTRDPVIKVSAPFINGITLSGSGNVTADRLTDEDIVIELSGSGNIIADRSESVYVRAKISGSGDIILRDIDCTDAEVIISGSGDLSAAGEGTNGIFRISGSGNSFTRELVIRNSTVTISGSGNLYTWTTNVLNAVISGSGNIYLKGIPQVFSNITGSGKIIEFK